MSGGNFSKNIIKVNLQAWWDGRCTINCEIEANLDMKIVDLLVIYHDRVIHIINSTKYAKNKYIE